MDQWIAWLGATVAAAFSLSTTFETKQDAKEKREQLERRLDRMESKQDQMIEILSRRR